MSDRFSVPRVTTLCNQSVDLLALTFWASRSECAGLGYATLVARDGDGSRFVRCAFRSCESHVSAVQTPASWSLGVERRLVMISEFQRMWKEAVEVCFKVPNVLAVWGSNLGCEGGFH